MTTQEVKRKLAAILSADVKGYSRLMGADEEGTLRTLTTYRELMTSLIEQHNGRVVNAPGDALLAEFESVVDAVKSAAEIQRELSKRNADLSPDRQMEYRIGINLGDVMADGESIYGDGVNIAARLESLSEPGGICISGTAFDQVRNKLNLGYEYLGEQSVKNIALPVRVYKVLMEPDTAGEVIGEKKAKPRQWQKMVLIAVAILIVVAAAIAGWRLYLHPTRPPVEVASIDKMAFSLPDKPSIAVLPFTNMSGDPKEEYFCDGLTEQIITSLSKIDRLFVIARNSTFVYKGKPLKIQKVAEDLGVQYVMEGSIQKSADRVRITAQLINALTGRHIWAETYDRDLKDIFALQDEITMNILTAVQGKLTEGEHALRSKIRETENLKAYEKVLQGRELVRRNTKQDNESARHLAEEAIVLDPNFAWAYVSLGWTHYMDVRFGWSESPAKSLQKASELAQKALAMDDSIDTAHSLLGSVYLVKLQFEKAVEEAERAVALNPNGAQGIIVLAGILGHAGRWEESVSYAKKSIRLDPVPDIFKLFILGRAQFMTGHYDESIAAWKKALQKNSDYLPAHAFLAACYSSSGRDVEATAEMKEVLRIDPKFNVESHAKLLPYKNKADIEREVNALQKAGLPEKPSASIPPSPEVAPKEKVTPPSPEKVSKPVTPPPPKVEVACKEKMAFPLPDKPSIAVLPFVNMGGDPSQDFLVDGITENIITALSAVPELFVIARNSTFTYKGKAVKVQQVAEELGVRYVLEGSILRSGDRIRVTAQLIDALKGHHLWAERYDRELKDIFALQDDLTAKILRGMHLKLTHGEQILAWKPARSLEVWLKLLQGLDYLRQFNIDSNNRARVIAEECITLESDFWGGYSLLGSVHMMDYWLGSTKNPAQSLNLAIEYVEKAVALTDRKGTSLQVLGNLYAIKKDYDKAIELGEQAIAVIPNGADAHAWLAMSLNLAGRPEQALPLFEKAMRLNPFPPSFYYLNCGHTYRMTGRFQEAIGMFKKSIELTPNSAPAHASLASAYGLMGREEEARAAAAELLRINPKFSVEYAAKISAYKRQEDTDQYIQGLRKAGLK